LAAALQGADVIGIEFQKRLVDFSVENFTDFEISSQIRIMNKDIVNPDTWKSLGQFDIIFCDNVIEHVHSPEGLVSAVGSLLKTGGYFYITAPNAYSFGMLRSECHYGLQGASLLDPNDAAVMLSFVRGQKTEYDVSFYYDYAEYIEIFTRYGLEPKHLLPLDGSDATVARIHNNLNVLINDLENIDLPDEIKSRYFERVRWYKNRFYADLNYFYGAENPQQRVSIAQRMNRDYEISLWYFVCKRSG
jgi:SAM-dependent methyltransferase